MTRRVVLLAVTTAVAALAAAPARASITLTPFGVSAEMQSADEVSWDSTGSRILITGRPRGDTRCCQSALWLAAPDGSGTRLDRGGEELRDASIAPDGRTVAWVAPWEERSAKVNVYREGEPVTSTPLPRVSKAEFYALVYRQTLVGPSGRVFALVDTYGGTTFLAEIPRNGPAVRVPGQGRERTADDVRNLVRSPDGRTFAQCERVKGRTRIGVLDPVAGRFRNRAVGRGFPQGCAVTDTGVVATTTFFTRRQLVVYDSRSGRLYRHNARGLGVLAAGPKRFLIGFLGRRLAVVTASGKSVSPVAVPKAYRIGSATPNPEETWWSADGAKAAVAFTTERARGGRGRPQHCARVDKLLIVDTERRKATRGVMRIPDGMTFDQMRFNASGNRLLVGGRRMVGHNRCGAGERRAWGVGVDGGGFVNLDAEGFSFANAWFPPTGGALVSAFDSSTDPGRHVLFTTAASDLGAEPFADAH